MTSKERINILLEGKYPDRIPFIPAIYEHKAALIKKTPSEVARDEDLLYNAIIEEFSSYSPDLITVGIDVYDVEAEAIGSKVNYDCGNEVPVIYEYILNNEPLEALKIPDPEKDGRMPLMINTARRVNQTIGNEVYICIGISGPFSLAASLMGAENILISMIENTEYLEKVLDYCLKVIIKYAEAIKKNGLELVVFDSSSAPPLVSPNLYKNIISPVVFRLFNFLKMNDFKFLSYIVGGNTENILDSILSTGANNILCDYNADLNKYLKKAKEKNILLRKNINPNIISSGTDEELISEVNNILDIGKEYFGFILGTAILQYSTDPKKVNLINQILNRNKKNNDLR